MYSTDAIRPDPQAVLQGDTWRITVLTPRLVRLEYSQTGQFTDSATQLAADRHFPPAPFRVSESGGSLQLTTEFLRLTYDKGPFSSTGLTIQITGKDSLYASVWHYGDEPHDLGGTARTLDGLWKFQFDPTGCGAAQGWQKGLPDPISMPVPASFSDFFTTRAERDYCGDFWYETEFFVPADWQGRVLLRFGSITHRAVVYCNGVEITRHEGGFLPVVADLTGAAVRGGVNRVSVQANNELSESSLPCGAVKTLPNGTTSWRNPISIFTIIRASSGASGW